jgi:RHS repeat-associated protein
MSASAPSQTVYSIGYDFHYGAGNNGNVWGITNYKDNTRNQSFTYDLLNRLTSAQNAGADCTKKALNPNQTEYWGNSYSYDAWGNLLAKSVTKCSAETFSVPALANNQLTGYGYDAAGNMTSDPTDGGLALSYDQENRISSAGGYTYTYDADGNRIKKTNGSTGTLYWYMSPGIVAESDLSGTLKSEYVFFDGERVARRDLPSGTVAYYFSDHLKTASVITDAAGNIKSESDYYPWGGELQFLANDSNHYKFTGKERDETGLDYFGARYYSNGLARFITPDWSSTPIPVPYAEFGDPQSLNQYSYVRNIPTTKADLDGHEIPVQVSDSAKFLGQELVGVGKGVVNFLPNTYNALAQLVNLQAANSGQNVQMPLAPTVPITNLGEAVGSGVATLGVSAYMGQTGSSAKAAEIGEGAGTEGGMAQKAVPESIPAGPSLRPTPAQQSAIDEMGEAHGCHTCGADSPGTKSGHWVGDHQPETALNPHGNPQVYKPHCLQCSRRQGGQVRAKQAKARTAVARAATSAKKEQETK